MLKLNHFIRIINIFMWLKKPNLTDLIVIKSGNPHPTPLHTQKELSSLLTINVVNVSGTCFISGCKISHHFSPFVLFRLWPLYPVEGLGWGDELPHTGIWLPFLLLVLWLPPLLGFC